MVNNFLLDASLCSSAVCCVIFFHSDLYQPIGGQKDTTPAYGYIWWQDAV